MILGYFHQGSAWPVPLVQASLWLSGIREQWTSIEFLIDTGAVRTCLHPLDAITQVGLSIETVGDPSRWATHETPGGIGGKALYFVVPAHYAFLKNDGDVHEIAGEIRVAHATVANLALPSLLGWDILQHLPLTTNWATRTITLG